MKPRLRYMLLTLLAFFWLPATQAAPALTSSPITVPQTSGSISTPIFESGITAQTRQLIQPAAAQPMLFTHGDPSPNEQYLLELVNRARANPAAEAARLGIDLNQGLAPGTITTAPKPPLALQPQLITTARAHSQWMLDTDTFSHTGVAGSSPGDRMESAGYPFSGSWTWGENIAWQGTTGTIQVTESTASMHDGWFLSAGHRANLMNASFDEVGMGLLTGRFESWNALMGTQDFARSDGTPGPLLTGVVYEDLNGNDFYDVGEGVANVTVRLTGGAYYAVTSTSGGFALPYTSGTGQLDVIFSDGSIPAPATRMVTGTGQNVKLDFVVNGESPPTSAAVGVFRNGQWFLDANGNGTWEGCGTEFCFTGFGQAGDMPASGNWDGGSKSYIGVLRSGTGEWFIDRNGNRQWDGCVADGCYVGFGAPGDLPVAGDWHGTGFAKIGVFRNGQWFLDANGNGKWDGCGTDLCQSFGQALDLPVAGNWNGGVPAGVGVFRAGTWYLDYNGNGQWDGCGVDRCYFGSFGQAGDLPAAGDWNGDGKAKVGVFRNGTWFLDYNGNGAWDGCSVDRCYFGSFGQQGDLPVAGKW